MMTKKKGREILKRLRGLTGFPRDEANEEFIFEVINFIESAMARNRRLEENVDDLHRKIASLK